MKFSHSSGGGFGFALPEWFKVGVESRFQSLLLPTHVGKHVHICVYINNFMYVCVHTYIYIKCVHTRQIHTHTQCLYTHKSYFH